MIPNEHPRYNPWSDFEREWKEYADQMEREYNKMVEEFERPFKEFEYLMKEFDRLAAEFDEMMKIPEIEEFNKMMKAYDRFFNNHDRMAERIERLKQSGGKAKPQSQREYARPQEDKEMSHSRGAWTVTTETLIVPESYLRLRSILKKIEDEMSSEEEFKKKH